MAVFTLSLGWQDPYVISVFALQVRQAVIAAKALLSWQEGDRCGFTILVHEGPLEACLLVLQAATLLPGGKQELNASDMHKVHLATS